MAKTKQFPKQELIDALMHDSEVLNVESDEILDITRWSVIRELIFHDSDSEAYYYTTFSVGSTEIQDQGPFEDEGDMIECVQVMQVEKTIKVWESVE